MFDPAPCRASTPKAAAPRDLSQVAAAAVLSAMEIHSSWRTALGALGANVEREASRCLGGLSVFQLVLGSTW